MTAEDVAGGAAGPNGLARARDPAETKRSPRQLERQRMCFELCVIEGLTHAEAALKLGINRKTVDRDVQVEAELRADELADRRETEKVMHLARLDDLYREALLLKDAPGLGALAVCEKVLAQRAKVLGLDAPTKIEIGIQGLLAALDVDVPSLPRPAVSASAIGTMPALPRGADGIPRGVAAPVEGELLDA